MFVGSTVTEHTRTHTLKCLCLMKMIMLIPFYKVLLEVGAVDELQPIWNTNVPINYGLNFQLFQERPVSLHLIKCVKIPDTVEMEIKMSQKDVFAI